MGNPVVHFEINGTDGPALEKFYAELFGWHVMSMPDMSYGLVDTHGGEGINGGISTARDGQAFVTFYVEGPDIQALLDKAESLGAKTLVPVTEMPMVTFALFADPQGNAIGLVKSDEGEAPGVSPGDGAHVSWFEVLGPEPDPLLAFYTQVFGWKATRSEMTGDKYFEVEAPDGRGIPGGVGSSPDGAGHVTLYAAVEDLDKYLERAEALGGKVVMPAMEVSKGTSVAQFADPQGNVFGLFRHVQAR